MQSDYRHLPNTYYTHFAQEYSARKLLLLHRQQQISVLRDCTISVNIYVCVFIFILIFIKLIDVKLLVEFYSRWVGECIVASTSRRIAQHCIDFSCCSSASCSCSSSRCFQIQWRWCFVWSNWQRLRSHLIPCLFDSMLIRNFVFAGWMVSCQPATFKQIIGYKSFKDPKSNMYRIVCVFDNVMELTKFPPVTSKIPAAADA